MTTLERGKTYYAPDGAKYELSHLYDGSAFCAPIQMAQGTNYHGDDFEEYEVVAEHFVELDPYSLTSEPPVATLSAEIANLREQRDELKKGITNLKKEKRDVEHNLSIANREVEVWKEDHPLFQEIYDLMHGGTFHTLESTTKYNTITIPKCLKDTDTLTIMTLKRTSQGWNWVTKNGRRVYGEDQYSVAELYRTEDEVKAEVLERWVKLLDLFNKSPDYSDGYTSNNRPNYGTLTGWKDAWPHLKIPSDLVEGRENYLRQYRQKEIEAAAKRLEKLKAKEPE